MSRAGQQAAADAPGRTGGQAVVAQLEALGVDTVFCVPGESYLAVLDALHDVGERIRTVVARHEGAAATMAEAHGKLTGTPGVCLVTRGPGATHAMFGLHSAWQDSTPMLLLVGQVPRAHLGRDAFQEVDLSGLAGTLAKRVERVMDPDRVPEVLARAASTARSGRPGPVVVELPEDVLAAPGAAAPVDPPVIAWPGPTAEQLARLGEMLDAAERPLALLGGGGWSSEARAGIADWLTATGVPAAVGFRRTDLLDHEHSGYVGHLGIGPSEALARCVRETDLLLAVGTRLGDIVTGHWSLVEAPEPRQPLVHVHPDPETIGAVVRPTLGIPARIDGFVASLEKVRPSDPGRWAGWREKARAAHLAHRTPGPARGDLDLAHAVAHLDSVLGDDAVFTNGAGNYTIWAHRYLRMRGARRHLAPVSGAMGYGLPAAIAAALARPGIPVVALAGDGCVQMTGAELATAVSERLPILLLIVDNARYGTIRMHQERRHPGRVHATSLDNPDFVSWARAHGAQAERVDRTEQFPAALDRALDASGPAVLHLVVDPDQLTPEMRVEDARRA